MNLDFQRRTALVTGASAGLGREFARLLGPEVGCLILTARRQERLDELAAELTRARPALRVLTRAVDLGDRTATGAMLDGLEKDGIGIDILINNAGFGDYGLFEQAEWPKLEQMLELNMVSATYLLHRLIPLMVARGFGAVLNVGSTAGMVNNPGMAVYSATKAYLNYLSETLRAELAGTGVVVTVLCPGPVETEFQAVAGDGSKVPMPRILFVEARACAAAALHGLKKGQARVIPGLPRVLAAVELLPKPISRLGAMYTGKKLRRA